MFVWSMKTTRARLIVGGAILGLLLAVILLCNGRSTTAVSDGGDDAKRLVYLQEQGYCSEYAENYDISEGYK